MSQVDDQSVPSALYDIASLLLPFANISKSTTFTSYNSSVEKNICFTLIIVIS